MAELDLEIGGSPDNIDSHALSLGVQQTVGLLDEYASAIGDSLGIRWKVRHMKSNGSLQIRFRSALKRQSNHAILNDNSIAIASGVVDGISIIDTQAKAPPYISDRGMRRVEAFVKAIERNEADSFTVRSQGMSASVTKKTGESLVKLIEVKRTSIGSVEGRLVGINVAGRTKLSIIHHITKRSVSCVVDDKYMDLAKEALGSRVVVYGILSKNVNGDTIRIQMREGGLQVFDSASMRKRLAEISVLPVPDFAKTTDTDEYLIGSRGE